ncbi:23551_t:CDS:1, partial [Gigaspora margarita]
MFDESGFKIFEHCELVSLEPFEKDETDRAATNRKLTINKLIERTHDKYWSIEENGNKNKKAEFIQKLKFCLKFYFSEIEKENFM